MGGNRVKRNPYRDKMAQARRLAWESHSKQLGRRARERRRADEPGDFFRLAVEIEELKERDTSLGKLGNLRLILAEADGSGRGAAPCLLHCSLATENAQLLLGRADLVLVEQVL
eukprot:scaffold200901_cov35-Tisochrysis_lutea.AAC.3